MHGKLSYGLNRLKIGLSYQSSALSRGPNLRKKLMPLPITEVGSGFADYATFPGATLDLDFSNNRGWIRGYGKGGVMDQITFSRPSNGSYIGADGLLKYGMSNFNQILTPQQQDTRTGGQWQLGGVTFSGTTTAPDGTFTAGTITETNATAIHQVILNSATSLTSGVTYTYSIHVKSIFGNRIIQMYPNFVPGGTAGAKFDLENETATAVNGTGSASASITNLGNGWYRCSVTFLCVSSSATSLFLTLAASEAQALNNSNVGDGESGIAFWGPQFEVGSSATEYYPTNYNMPRFDWQYSAWTNKNLIPYSDNFTSVGWAQAAGSTVIYGNTPDTTAPDGSYTAAKVFETAINNNHIVNRNPAAQGTVLNKWYTLSVYVKRGTRDYFSMSHDGGALTRTWFNIANGTLGTVSEFHRAEITDAGNGWYRCSVTFFAASNSFNPNFYLNVSNGQATYVGDPTQYMYLWGAQCEQSESATSYMANTSGKNMLFASEDFNNTSYWSTLRGGYVKASLIYSTEDFSTTRWTKTGGTISGLPGANVFTATAGSSVHNFVSAVGVTVYSGTQYTSAIRIAKGTEANAQSIIQLGFSSANFPNSYVNFNVTTGAVENSFNGSANVINVGGGIYDLVFTATANLTSGAAGITISFTGNSITNGRTPSFLAVNNSDMIIYNSYFTPGNVFEGYANSSSLTTYGYSPILYSSPDGGNNAMKVMGLATSDNTHGIYQQMGTFTGQNHNFSVHAKAGEYDTLMLSIGSTLNNPIGYSTTYDLTSGTVIANGTFTRNPEINAVGNGWFRCSMTANVAGNPTRAVIFTGPRASLNANASLNSNSFFETFTPNASDGLYIWGAQVEAGNTITANTEYEASPMFYPYYATLEKPASVCNGILQEESRTNLILWCRDGTQSVWTKTNCDVALTETGIDGRANSATRLTANGVNATFVQQITRAQDWYASSIYVKRLTGNGVVQITHDGIIWTDFSIDTNWTRVFSYGWIQNPAIGIRIVNSGDELAVDFAQLEATGVGASSAIATSPIYTAGVAATRAVDYILLSSGAYASAFFPMSHGTIYTEIVQTPTMQYFYGHYGNMYRIGNVGNRSMGYNNSILQPLLSNSAGGAQAAMLPKPGTYKLAGSWDNEGRMVRFYCGPRAGTTTAEVRNNGVFPGGTQLQIGINNANAFNGCIKRLVFIPKMLTTAACREMVKTGD